MLPENANDPPQSKAFPASEVTAQFGQDPPPANGGTAVYMPGQGKEPTSTEPTPVPESLSVPGYQIEDVLGRGGMGVVYKARHLRLNRMVALKMILAGSHAGPADLQRFLVEAEAVAQLQHPNIVQIFESGQQEGLPFLTLEYVSGGSLADKVREQPLPPREAAQLVEQLARGIGYAHERGIVHRDLKPENVLLAADGTPKVTDFGLAKRVESGANLTATGAVMGTPSYMAPEQAGGQTATVGPLADVYALGAILYRVLTGRPPFQAATALDTLMQVVNVEPVPPRQLQPTLPRDLETIALKCLHKEPGRRYDSALALAEDLRRFLAGEPILARPVSTLERGVKWVKRRPVVAALVAVIALLLITGTAVSTWFAVEAAQRAAEAETNAQLARSKEKEARDEGIKANQANQQLRLAEEKTRRTLYSAQMNLIPVAWEADNISRVRDLLEEMRPDPGQLDLRSFEWRYWNRLSHRELWTVNFGRPHVTEMVFNPDASRLAAITVLEKPSSTKYALRVWDTRPGKEYLTVEEVEGSIDGLTYSADGKHLTATVNKEVKIWDAATGKLLRGFACVEPISQVRSNADRKRLMAVVNIKGKTKATDAVKVWDSATGKELGTHPLPASFDRKVVFSPDGKRYAMIAKGKDKDQFEVKVWDTDTGRDLATCRLAFGEMALFSKITFSSDSKRIALPVVRFDPELIKKVESRPMSKEMDFIKRGQNTATGALRVWDAETGKELLFLKGIPATKVVLAFSSDGADLAALDAAAGGLTVWDSSSGKVKFTDPGRGSPVGAGGLQGIKPMLTIFEPGLVFSRDRKFLCATGFGMTVKVWDLTQGKLRLNLKGHTGVPVAGAFSPDGRLLYSAGMDGTLKAWQNSPLDELIAFPGGNMFGLGAVLSSDGKRMTMLDPGLVSDNQSKPGSFIRVVDIGTQKVLLTIKVAVAQYGVGGMTFSPDGRWLAGVVSTFSAGKVSAEMKVWDAITGKEFFAFPDQKTNPGLIGGLVFSNDGQRLAVLITGGALPGGCEVKVWDLGIRKEPLTIRSGNLMWALALSPDGNLLAVAEMSKQTTVVVLRDAATGREIRTLHLGLRQQGRLVFSPDGKQVVVATMDFNFSVPSTEVTMWDLDSGQRRFFLKIPNLMNVLLAFTPDGKRLATTGFAISPTSQTGNDVKIWDALTGMELTTLRGQLANPTSMVFTADGHKLLVIGQNLLTGQSLQVWDATPRAEK